MQRRPTPPAKMFLESCFAFIVGTGIGAYNHEHLRPCLSDTATVSRQKAVPVARAIGSKAQEAAAQAAPYVRQYSSNVKDKAAPYLKMAQDKVNQMGRK
mmetsp:Transcript_66551/g.210384  ORF Transcript_66551/g.210384 Transcript_66551/m.210384 type:complete len:99 (-) Transcript_66551:361-657(-)